MCASILTTSDLIVNSEKYNEQGVERKSYYAASIQYCAVLGVSRNDLPTKLQEKLDEWLGRGGGDKTSGFGTREAGMGTLPGGSESSGSTGIPFHQISALGDDWKHLFAGYYDTASYREAERAEEVLEFSLKRYEPWETNMGGGTQSLSHCGHLWPPAGVTGCQGRKMNTLPGWPLTNDPKSTRHGRMVCWAMLLCLARLGSSQTRAAQSACRDRERGALCQFQQGSTETVRGHCYVLSVWRDGSGGAWDFDGSGRSTTLACVRGSMALCLGLNLSTWLLAVLTMGNFLPGQFLDIFIILCHSNVHPIALLFHVISAAFSCSNVDFNVVEWLYGQFAQCILLCAFTWDTGWQGGEERRQDFTARIQALTELGPRTRTPRVGAPSRVSASSRAAALEHPLAGRSAWRLSWASGVNQWIWWAVM
eukprot:g4050.t1